MESIRKIYKIGFGPSSSHTMGPRRAAETFKEKHPLAARFHVTLFGSLAATGKGHLTDRAIINALAPTPVDITWKPDTFLPFHNNAMTFEALDADNTVSDSQTLYSIGGGELSDGTPSDERHIYEHVKMRQIMEYCSKEGLWLWEYVERHEDEDLWEYLATVWEQMQQTIHTGLHADRVLPGQLHLHSKARQYYVRATSYRENLQGRCLVIAYALATAEQNAMGGKVVSAPTCGSAGVLPAVLYHLKRVHNFSDLSILKALATAGLFANVIKTNASLSGAEVGCQGEVGSACVMAAVASNQLFGGTPAQIEYAAEMAMEHNLGLTCDPVCGLVQVPCIERNAMAALRALDVNMYATISDGNHMISFDKVVETMNLTGKDLPSLYKETALGGLALDEGKEQSSNGH
ncbi:MAG: L-serine ammonia-lyase, iron-sulfur-dependent, subunit alpha [Bacteroidales bacterium]|nr:L-serine ammonia-lyase, iron-sulfur-dependent, subunit alpha [Bacteroidales bacterium]